MCRVWESLLQAFHELGVLKDIPEAAAQVMEAFCKVNLGLTLLDSRGVHCIVLVAEKVIHEPVEKSEYKRPCHEEVVGIVCAGVDNFGVGRLGRPVEE